MTAQELDQENKRQNEVSSELSQLTSILKEVTIQMNESVKQQNIVCLYEIASSLFYYMTDDLTLNC